MKQSQKSTSYEERRDRYTIETLVKYQKKKAIVVGPIFVIVVLVVWMVSPAWQFAAITVAMVTIEICFILSLFYARRGLIHKSVWLSMLPVQLFSALVTSMVHGYLMVAMTACLTSIIHTAIFSIRVAVIGLVIVVLTYANAAILSTFEPYPFFTVEPTSLLVSNLILNIVLYLQFFVAIVHYRQIQERALNESRELNDQQEKMINTIYTIEPVINSAVAHILAISQDFSSKANEHAVAVSRMASTVEEMAQTSLRNVDTAEDTRHIAEQTREELLVNSNRLGEVQRGFEDVFEHMASTRDAMSVLAKQVGRISGILDSNRAIGEHITVLAVNAAIEAARAGEYGRGFNVVSQELREMIADTEKNLTSSHLLLDEVMNQSQTSDHAIDVTYGKLKAYFSELKTTSQTIEKSMSGFLQTSKQVIQIAQLSKKQAAKLDSMNEVVNGIQTTSENLAGFSQRLLEAVQQIRESHTKLNTALETESLKKSV